MRYIIELVPASWTKVRLPLPPSEPPFDWLASGAIPPYVSCTETIDVELLPWKCLNGLHPQMGYAGWARTGDILMGFVCEGPSAPAVAHDLQATLDLISVSYNSLEKYRGEAVAEAYVKRRQEADKQRGELVRNQLVEEAIDKLRRGMS